MGKTYVKGGLVQPVGAQTFNDPVIVGNTATEFTSTSAGDITFAKTLDGAQTVTINTTGITEAAAAGVSVYPVPSNDQVTISWNEPVCGTVNVYDLN